MSRTSIWSAAPRVWTVVVAALAVPAMGAKPPDIGMHITTSVGSSDGPAILPSDAIIIGSAPCKQARIDTIPDMSISCTVSPGGCSPDLTVSSCQPPKPPPAPPRLTPGQIKARKIKALTHLYFDPTFYRNNNSDLARAGIKTRAQLQAHWERHGKKEGRRPSPFYNPKYYRKANPDLKAKFGKNWKKLFNHWIKKGIWEGRFASRVFNAKSYRRKHSDLRKKFDKKWANYHTHWLRYGWREGRDAKP